MPKKSDIQRIESELAFPIQGVEESRGFSRQREGTSADAVNVVAVDTLTGRGSGSTRPGSEKLYYTNYDGTAVTDAPIQDINQLTTTVPPPPITGDFQEYTYAQVSGSGASIGSGNDGINISTFGVASGFAMACTCWDDDGNAYVAMLNTTTGSLNIFRIPPPWTSSGGIYSGTSPIAVATGSLRNVAGMCAIKLSASLTYLFIAIKPVSGGAQIWRMNAFTGVIIDGAQPFTATNATLQDLTFSTSAHNVLATAGGVLGVESAGGVANQGFRTFNPTIAPITTAPSAETVAIKGLLSYTAWGGSRSDTAVKVVSDGSNFYCIASVTALKLKKISSGGVLIQENTTSYQTAAAGNPLALDIDFRTAKLVLASSVAPYIRLVTTADITASPTTGSPGSAAQWDEVGADGNGTFMLWRNAASNNWMTVDTSVTAVLAMGAHDIPNSTNYGASVNKGVGSAPPLPGFSPTVLISLLVKGGVVMPVTEDGPKKILNAAGSSGGVTFNPIAPEVFSSQNGPNMYFADGTVYQYYKGSEGRMRLWTPTDGTLPVDENGRPSKLIATWNGRTILAIGRNFYMSKQFDALNWQYNPSTVTSARAFSGNADLAGALGNLITSIIPFNDDTCLFGMDHTLWQLTGDPTTNGAFDVVSSSIGVAFGRPWCFDSQNFLYFFGSDCMVYKMAPTGGQPLPIGGQIRERLKRVNLTTSRVKMVWDQDKDRLYLFVTPLGSADAYEAPNSGVPTFEDFPTSSATTSKRWGDTTNFIWEKRTEAWFPHKHSNRNHNPMAVYSYDGDLPQDRRVYMGGRDGYVRLLANDGGNDDGTDIYSYVLLGPIMTPNWENMVHERMQSTLSANSGEIRWDLYHGESAQAALVKALAGESTINGVWQAGRNRVTPTNREGFAFYLKLTSTDYAAIERIQQAFRTTGAVRRWQ